MRLSISTNNFRYFVLEIVHPPHCNTLKILQEQKLTSQDVYNSVKEEVQRTHGDYGLAAVTISCNGEVLNTDICTGM